MSADSRASTDRPLSLVSAATWTIGLWLLEQICVGVIAANRPSATTDIVSLSASIVLATSIVIFAMVRVRAPEESLRSVVGVRPVGPLGLLLSVAIGAGLCPVLSTLDDRIVSRWPYDDAQAIDNMQQLVARSSRFAFVAALFVVIPIAREVFFRGILLGELVRGRQSKDTWRSTGLGVLATAILFAAFSQDWQTMPSTLVLGLALACVRVRERSVVAAIVSHLGFWGIVSLPILRGGDPAADVTYPVWSIAGGGVVVAVALALMFVKTRRGTP